MTFAEDFARGVALGTEQKRRAEELSMQQKLQRQQWEQQQRMLAQRDALQKLELWKSMPQPEQALPTGQAGPPAPMPVPEVEVPSLAPGGAPMRVRPQTMTDLLVQNRAQQDLERTNKLEDYRNQQQVAEDFSKIDLSQVPPEARFGLSGIVDPKVYEGAKARAMLNEQVAGRAQEAAARREQKQREAEEKRTAMETAADSYVQAAKGFQAVEVPSALKPLVQERAIKAGVKLLNPKEAAGAQDLLTIINLTREVNALYKPEYVGIAEGRFPTWASNDPQFQEFRAKTQRLYDIQAKYNSGQAVVGSEELRLNRELPRPTDNESGFTTKTSALLQEAEDKLERLTSLNPRAVKPRGSSPAGNPQGNEAELQEARDLIDKYLPKK